MKAGDAAPPFEIMLALEAGPRLRARLHNRSTQAQWVLLAPDLQPSVMRLSDEGGVAASAADDRLRRKFDGTVYRDAWTLLPAGGHAALGMGVFSRRADGHHDFAWGPFRFVHLAPGHWTAELAWTSRVDTWMDRSTGQWGRVDGLWRGTVASGPVAVELR